jgi:hypothetical protein
VFYRGHRDQPITHKLGERAVDLAEAQRAGRAEVAIMGLLQVVAVPRVLF